MRNIGIVFVIVLLLGGCAPKQTEQAAHEEESVRRTVWTSKTELFMEYDEPVAGKKSGFLVHLTDLSGFKPVTEGRLTLTFVPKSGEPLAVMIEKPDRPGIFKTEVAFKEQGNYDMTVSLQGRALSDVISVGAVDVHGGDKKPAHHGDTGGGDISFLKEQQWTIDFMVGLPLRRDVSSSFVAAGEIVPAANAEATLSAPLAGVVSLSQRLPYAGKRLKAGEVVAVIEPPINQQGGIGQLSASYAEAKNRVTLAQKEYDRAKRLYEAKAVPKRRLEDAELGLESAKAAFEPLDRAVQEMKPGASGNKVIIRAPFGGTVVELLTANGKAVDAGQPILRLIDTSSVWLRANVPASEIGGIKNLEKATFTVAGNGGTFKPSRLITVSDVIDARTRTVPVTFEVNNSGGRLKIGMFADVSIETGHVANTRTLPEEALFEDEGRTFVFVQKEGESFERREVKTGVRGNGFVAIISGLQEGERVVFKGGYYVKLASLSSRTAQGHGHDH